MHQAYSMHERKKRAIEERYGLGSYIIMWSCQWHRLRQQENIKQFLTGLDLRPPMVVRWGFVGEIIA